ncbi:hypothetical protein NDU88_004038 [Pleurodeles waltl]|uniref:Uncharacterized protein n=1 Tax=Pleurodeles waltl TaxID=8319 RepID=A0AAV7T6U2_PLEWA|nr:hypothetical protein NDU88_004038 [Pleurodeles waltl]
MAQHDGASRVPLNKGDKPPTEVQHRCWEGPPAEGPPPKRGHGSAALMDWAGGARPPPRPMRNEARTQIKTTPRDTPGPPWPPMRRSRGAEPPLRTDRERHSSVAWRVRAAAHRGWRSAAAT